MVDPKNVTITVLVAVIAFFIRERRLFHYNSHLHNVIHNSYLPPQEVHEKLKQHTAEFNHPEIVRVADGVYVAIGYALANTIIIEADTSLIIVDTMESLESARAARSDFVKKTPPSVHNKAVGTIIYTHYHPDHTFGTSAWIDEDADPIPSIISHPRTLKEMTRIFSVASSIANIRATRQFGPLLHEYDQTHYHQHHGHRHSHDHHAHGPSGHPHEHIDGVFDFQSMLGKRGQNGSVDFNDGDNAFSNVFENSGIGPFLLSGPKWTKSLNLPSTLLTEESTDLNIDGVELRIVHAPGETVDQIFVYLTSKRVLLPADNIYRAFPNIYAIRGTPTRDARDWTKSLDKMRALQPPPLILVPSHTQPIYGEHAIHELLTVYRDGISYVHDQTIRYMNMGLTADQMIPLIHENMPHRLRDHPHLQEFYGTVDWSVRGIFHSYLGWFSGDAADLFPLPKNEIGNRLISLLHDDVDHILGVISEHIEKEKGRASCQWGLRLATNLLHSDGDRLSAEQRTLAEDLRVNALQCMASFMTSANGRNYYLTSALEEITKTTIGVYDELKEFALNNMPMDHVIAMLRVRMRVDQIPEQYRNFSICHDFEESWYHLELRDGIMEISKGSADGRETLGEIARKMNDEAYIDKAITREECQESADVVTLCTHQVYRDAIAGVRTTPAMLYAKGLFQITKGNIGEMVKFREMFEKQ